ncbi:hypothetical protein FRAAL5323 [Frankia alni ACN14a]|uniref:Uncharacterized protein n=1 Tax=Frankia alni (strain DSM 45986 / CECT 9034 / ACN14a) TaxID=326424 RepID=Q0REZ6_FRAAA|nr:hypothetical protein FRAAL5323 [Frankia alni ACN14a]
MGFVARRASSQPRRRFRGTGRAWGPGSERGRTVRFGIRLHVITRDRAEDGNRPFLPAAAH